MTLDKLYDLILHTLINNRITVYGFGNKTNTFGYASLGPVLSICRYWNNCTIYQLNVDIIEIPRFV